MWFENLQTVALNILPASQRVVNTTDSNLRKLPTFACMFIVKEPLLSILPQPSFDVVNDYSGFCNGWTIYTREHVYTCLRICILRTLNIGGK